MKMTNSRLSLSIAVGLYIIGSSALAETPTYRTSGSDNPDVHAGHGLVAPFLKKPTRSPAADDTSTKGHTGHSHPLKRVIEAGPH